MRRKQGTRAPGASTSANCSCRTGSCPTAAAGGRRPSLAHQGAELQNLEASLGWFFHKVGGPTDLLSVVAKLVCRARAQRRQAAGGLHVTVARGGDFPARISSPPHSQMYRPIKACVASGLVVQVGSAEAAQDAAAASSTAQGTGRRNGSTQRCSATGATAGALLRGCANGAHPPPAEALPTYRVRIEGRQTS